MSKTPYDTSIKSRLSFDCTKDFLAAVRLHCDMLPEYMPMKWGWTEPLKQIFDPKNIEALVENDKPYYVFWKRSGKHKATGSWGTRWGPMDSPRRTHASIGISVYETTLQDKLVSYLKVGSQLHEADFSFIDSVAKPYFDFALASHITQAVGKDYPESWHFNFSTHTLRHWLPDMPWSVVFGPAYVRMFGKERLLSMPAFLVEDLGPELVFIQLTPRMEDIHERFDEVMAARAVAKRHLGEDAFFKQELAYDYKDPANADKAGQVFRVPTFELLPA